MRPTPHKAPLNPYPLALLSASLAAGILLARLGAPPLAASLLISATLSLLAVFAFARRRYGVATLFVIVAFASAGATLFVVEHESIAANRLRRWYEEGRIASGEPVELTGVVERAPELTPDGFHLSLRVESLRFKGEESAASGRALLYAPTQDARVRAEYEALELRRGARARVMTALRREDELRNPGVASFVEFLDRRGFDASGAIASPLLIERLDDERIFLPLFWLEEWRAMLLAEMERQFSADTSSVLKAALLGNRHYLSRPTAERFREGGTFHVLVISGLHISFVGGLAWLIAGRLTRRRAWQYAASVTFLWAYTFAVGAGGPVVRAALMFSLIALAPVLNRPATALNALGGAALALLLWRPADLFDPSFQLTFLSVLVIVTLAWPLWMKLKEIGEWRPSRVTPSPPVCLRSVRIISEALFWSEREWQREMQRSIYDCKLFKTPWAIRLERYGAQRLLRYACGAVVVSASVQFGMLPALVLYFHRLSLAAIALNIVVGALMATLALLSLMALVLAQVSELLSLPFIWLAEQSNWLMTHSVDPLAAIGLAQWRLPEYSGWAAGIYALYYAPLILLAISLARWQPLRLAVEKRQAESAATHQWLPGWRGVALAQLLLLVVIVAHPMSAGRLDGRLRVDFLDVGQGDAALITMPDGTTLLIDAGGRLRYDTAREGAEGASEPFVRDTRSIGEGVVAEYLWYRGLARVDYLLATHADADHMEGLSDIARNFSVRAVLIARAPRREPEFARFAATVREQRIPLYLLGRGDRLRFGDVTAEILWPVRSAPGEVAGWGNEASLVLSLRFGDRTFLFTGDIERVAEAALARAPEALRADAVKVAHHGSRTSSSAAFVAAARPTYAIIPVGRQSPFGHPHESVLARWRAAGAQVLITGQHGMITLSTDGRDLRLETYEESRGQRSEVRDQ